MQAGVDERRVRRLCAADPWLLRNDRAEVQMRGSPCLGCAAMPSMMSCAAPAETVTSTSRALFGAERWSNLVVVAARASVNDLIVIDRYRSSPWCSSTSIARTPKFTALRSCRAAAADDERCHRRDRRYAWMGAEARNWCQGASAKLDRVDLAFVLDFGGLDLPHRQGPEGPLRPRRVRKGECGRRLVHDRITGSRRPRAETRTEHASADAC